MTSQTGTELRLERRLKAPAEAVFAALTSDAAVARWFGPSDDFEVKVHEWDCRLGGRYRVEFVTPSGEHHIVMGEFNALEPNRTVAYTWSWEGQPPIETVVTFRIEGGEVESRLRFSHEGFPGEEMRDHHLTGWSGSMDRLEWELEGS